MTDRCVALPVIKLPDRGGGRREGRKGREEGEGREGRERREEGREEGK